MLCWFLQYNSICLLKCAYIPSLLRLPPTPPSHPPGVTGHRAELPKLYNNFAPAIWFTRCNVDVSVLLSQCIPPHPPTLKQSFRKHFGKAERELDSTSSDHSYVMYPSLSKTYSHLFCSSVCIFFFQVPFQLKCDFPESRNIVHLFFQPPLGW